jgi:hypothetical protein
MLGMMQQGNGGPIQSPLEGINRGARQALLGAYGAGMFNFGPSPISPAATMDAWRQLPESYTMPGIFPVAG